MIFINDLHAERVDLLTSLRLERCQMSYVDDIEHSGFAILPHFLDAETVSLALEALATAKGRQRCRYQKPSQRCTLHPRSGEQLRLSITCRGHPWPKRTRRPWHLLRQTQRCELESRLAPGPDHRRPRTARRFMSRRHRPRRLRPVVPQSRHTSRPTTRIGPGEHANPAPPPGPHRRIQRRPSRPPRHAPPRPPKSISDRPPQTMPPPHHLHRPPRRRLINAPAM
jgi:hypothetical protein